MATATYEPIATTTLGSSSASIVFSSIPSTFSDLRLVVHAITTGSGNMGIRFNTDTGTNYSVTNLTASVTSSSSTRTTNANGAIVGGNSILSTSPASFIFDIINYSNTSYNKSFLTTINMNKGTTAGSVELVSGLWRGVNAISTVTLYLSLNSFNTNTTATLYGIARA